VLATKVYSTMADWPNETFLSARNIVRACEASLRRLRTDWIDLYQFHHVDLRTPWAEIWQACETLVTQGKVLYFGSSNHAGWQIAAANEAAARRPFQGLVSEQSIYNLLTRQIELEVIPAARHYGVGIIPWSPLHGGLLAGALEKSSEGSRRYEGRAKQDLEENRAALEEYEALCRDLGETPADVGLAWLLHQPAVTAPIVGPRTMEQFEGALSALDVQLDDEQLARLDEIFPGYKAAPMEYAW
jgi:aryl-alcohol dehydrogenase-like predicted oxidoreductase